MNKAYKIILLYTLFFFVVLTALTQQNYFVYIQTENKQPFYIKLNNKLLSSSASGYLIIPKLQDGSYQLTIGFLKNEWTEQNINCIVNKKDAGYLLKDLGDKGWGLFNLQTMEVLMSGNASVNDKVIWEEDKKMPVVILPPNINTADSAITKTANEKSVTKEEEPKPFIEIVKTDTVKTVIETSKVKDEKPVSQITKLLSVNTAEGAEMIYIDLVNGKPDTIIVFIPAQKDAPIIVKAEKKAEDPKIEQLKVNELKVQEPKIEEPKVQEPQTQQLKIEEPKAQEPKAQEPKVQEPKAQEPKVQEPKVQEPKVQEPKVQEPKVQEPKVQEPKVQEPKVQELKIETKKVEAGANDIKFIDITLPNPNAKADSSIKQIKPEVITDGKNDSVPTPQKQKENLTKPVITNSDCKSLAAEDDFLKLRKKMAAAITHDDMITVAKKIFKTKCFTTIQVKNLCVLFLNDEGKYKFFDAAYPFVSDSYNFGSLETQLTDNYFINRFKAMIHH